MARRRASDETKETAKKRGEHTRGGRHNYAWQPAFLEHIRSGRSITGAAVAAGVARATVYRALEKDEAFAAELTDAWEHGTDLVEDLLLQDAQHPGQFVPKLAILRARRPAKYREKFEVEHRGHVLIWDLPGPKEVPKSSSSSAKSAAGAPG